MAQLSFSFESLEARRMLSAAQVTTLLSDSFTGNRVNAHHWHMLPFDPAGSSFLGRTQLRTSENEPLPAVSHGAVHLTLDSFNPTSLPGSPSFYGTQLVSNQTFKLQAGVSLDFKVRAKLNAPIKGGIVGGLFLYFLKPSHLHDEIDTELLSNQVITRTNHPQTNIYANQGLGAGLPRFSTTPISAPLTSYHTYEIKINPAKSVSWYTDGKLTRIERHIVPHGPFKVYLNIWAPAAEWAEAFSSTIQPTAIASQNHRYSMDVDNILVRSIKQ
jgi:hypothetical protein